MAENNCVKRKKKSITPVGYVPDNHTHYEYYVKYYDHYFLEMRPPRHLARVYNMLYWYL